MKVGIDHIDHTYHTDHLSEVWTLELPSTVRAGDIKRPP